MKKKIITLLFVSFSFVVYSQKYFSNGIIPSQSFLVGIESGGSYTEITAAYSGTGKKMRIYGLRSVPKIAYAPIDNLLIGAYYEYEFLYVDGIKYASNYGYGGFARYYLPFINKLLKVNNSKFLNNRLLFFSELYLEKNNYIHLANEKGTGVSDNLNTFFYGVKMGINYRMFNKFYIEVAYVQNFDNQNGDFQIFHPELGIEYIFNMKK